MIAIENTTRGILFAGHDFRFLRPFIAYCQGSSHFKVLLDEHQGHEITNLEKSAQLLKDAELIFCEWCLGNAVWYSRHKLPGQRLVIRLHAQEMRLHFLERVQWDSVDALILICPLNRNLVLKRLPSLQPKAHLIYNPIPSKALSQPKLPGAEFNLGMMGISPKLKAPHLAFEVLARLKQVDGRFTLFVKGKHPRQYDWLWRRPEERAYYKRLFDDIDNSAYANSVVFENYSDDVPLWFSKVGFVLSTSDFEGSHQSVAEGMASGAIPIIRNWAGADLIYPPKYMFRTVDEAVQAVLKLSNSIVYGEEMDFCRSYAVEHFDQDKICAELEAVLTGEVPSRSACPACLDSHRPLEPARPRLMILGYLPPGASGGYRIRIEQQIRALTRAGCDVHLACLHPPAATSHELELLRTSLVALGCTVHLVPTEGFFELRLAAEGVQSCLDALEQIVKGNDLQILQAEALYCMRVAIMLKERCPALRLVFDCHGATPAEERLSGAHPSRVTVMAHWERRALTEADLNVFVSAAMNDFFVEEYGAITTPHCIVPCCVSNERFPSGSVQSSVPPLPADRLILVYLGTMAAWQCGEEMVRLFAQLHSADPKTFFVMLVPRSDHKKVQDLMAKHSVPRDSVFVTERPHDQVPAVLQLGHAGLLLRRDHPVNRVSSPTKFAEYLAAGLPVIMTDQIGDFSSMAGAGEIGLVLDSKILETDRFPHTELARIVEFLRETANGRERVSSQCQTLAREHLSWDQASAILLDHYRMMLADATDPPHPRRPA